MNGNKSIPSYRYFLAEFVGTLILTFADAGVGVAASLATQGEITLAARAAAPGLAVLALIFAFGEVSGAHLNPAVTFSFALRKVFPWRRVFPYWIMQFLGALVAAALLWLLFGSAGEVGATLPHQGEASALAIEIILSSILFSVILATSHQHKIKGPQGAFPVAAAIAACALVGKATSGGSMNPARSFGPALFSGHLNSFWVYVVGPILGALVAVLVVRVIHGQPKFSDDEAAQGEKNVVQR